VNIRRLPNAEEGETPGRTFIRKRDQPSETVCGSVRLLGQTWPGLGVPQTGRACEPGLSVGHPQIAAQGGYECGAEFVLWLWLGSHLRAIAWLDIALPKNVLSVANIVLVPVNSPD
jgi:hypothetical protein